MVRSRWKGIHILKQIRWKDQDYQTLWWVKNVVLTEFFLRKNFKVYCGRVPHTVNINDIEFLGSKLGEYVQTRVPFVHRRAKNKKKKDKKKTKKVRMKQVEMSTSVRTFIRSKYTPFKQNLQIS